MKGSIACNGLYIAHVFYNRRTALYNRCMDRMERPSYDVKCCRMRPVSKVVQIAWSDLGKLRASYDGFYNACQRRGGAAGAGGGGANPADIMVLMLPDKRGDDHNFREQCVFVNDVAGESCVLAKQ
ncbi:hypothetical protein EVAR_102191_1 [Eumeta japonica]|uniref:Uncharacterized protein n=1 Tax=Eumeta variegata TaxID=151549 RepID=A0A4C1T505_EUMVA|nr:hypothetical protein EVAR_102191_1 [Eumeta japonica]